MQGDDHILLGNTFRDLRQPKNYFYWPLSFMAADLETYGDTDSLSGYGRAKNILITRNRFEQCDKRIAAGIYLRPEYPLLPQNIRVVENVFTGTTATNAFDFVADDPSGGLANELHEEKNEFRP